VAGVYTVRLQHRRQTRTATPGPVRGKVIITCEVTGSIHTPAISPHLPLTPDEIARNAIAAAGAAILHLLNTQRAEAVSCLTPT